MPCVCEPIFCVPYIFYQEGGDATMTAASATFLPEVHFWLRLHQTITWYLHGSRGSCQVKRKFFRAKGSPCFKHDASVKVVRSMLNSLNLPDSLTGMQRHELACGVAEYVHQSLEDIPGEGLLRVHLEVVIKVAADLEGDVANVWFDLSSVQHDGGNSGGDDRDFWAVCLEEFKSGMELERTPCGHCFYEGCIRPWLMAGHHTRPLCRTEVPGTVTAEGTVFHL